MAILFKDFLGASPGGHPGPENKAGARGRKLLILSPSPSRGGAEEHNLVIARAAHEAGWSVAAGFSSSSALDSLARDMETSGVTVHPLEIIDVGWRKPAALAPLHAWRTRQLLRRASPDVVLLSLCGLQYGLGPLLACAAAGIPTRALVHLVRPDLEILPLRRALNRFMLRHRVRFATVSRSNQAMLAHAFDLPESELLMVPNGIEIERFERPPAIREALGRRIREELHLPPDALIVITVGRLTTQKGHDLLVPVIPHVVAQHPNACFVWAGDGPERQGLLQKAATYGIADSIRITGYRDDIPDLLNAADLFILPTRFEGQPFSVMEAMAASVPVIVSNVSSVGELIEDRVHGLLTQPEDIRDLREALLFALNHRNAMQSIAAAARNRIGTFTRQAMIAANLAMLDEASQS